MIEVTTYQLGVNTKNKLEPDKPLPRCPHPLAGTSAHLNVAPVYPLGIVPKVPGSQPSGYTVSFFGAVAEMIGIELTFVFNSGPAMVVVVGP